MPRPAPVEGASLAFKAAMEHLLHVHELELSDLREEVKALRAKACGTSASDNNDLGGNPAGAKEYEVQNQFEIQKPPAAQVAPAAGQDEETTATSMQAAISSTAPPTTDVEVAAPPRPQMMQSKSFSIEEPEYSTDEEDKKKGLDWLMGTPLDIGAAMMILANTFVMLAHSQWIGYTNGVILGRSSPGSWQHAEETFDGFEYLFTIVFLLELMMRLFWFGLVFLKDPLNFLDAMVVATTTLDTFVLSRLNIKAGVGVIRLIRMVKLAKTLRFARAMKLFEPLRILMRTIAGSVLSLFWSMIILIMFMLVAAILTSQMLQSFVTDEDAPLEHREWVDEHYGDAWKALWTMFEITLSGGWPNWVTPLVRNVSTLYAVFFGIYVSVVVFAVIRVITALFLKTTMAEAAKDNDTLVKDKMKQRQTIINKLMAVFNASDKDANGVLSELEFERALTDRKICSMFYALDMEPDQLGAVFHILDDGDGEVSLEEFLEGIMRMKGSSRSTDLLHLMHDNKTVMRTLEGIETHLGMHVKHIHHQ